MPSVSDLSPEARDFLLAFADDEHLMGQRHTEWLGVAPFLEEDLAFASIGQDELGHAADLYGSVLDPTGSGSDLDPRQTELAVDRLAFDRPAEEYRSCWLVEYETTDWAETAVRHWFYDTAEEYRWRLLAGSSVPAAAALVDRAMREESYHRRHIDGLFDVLLEVDESRRRIEFAAAELFPMALAIFDPTAGEERLVAEGVISGPWSELVETWEGRVVERFPSIDWAQVERGTIAAAQENRSKRHKDFSIVHSRIREVFDFDPTAVW